MKDWIVIIRREREIREIGRNQLETVEEIIAFDCKSEDEATLTGRANAQKGDVINVCRVVSTGLARVVVDFNGDGAELDDGDAEVESHPCNVCSTGRYYGEADREINGGGMCPKCFAMRQDEIAKGAIQVGDKPKKGRKPKATEPAPTPGEPDGGPDSPPTFACGICAEVRPAGDPWALGAKGDPICPACKDTIDRVLPAPAAGSAAARAAAAWSAPAPTPAVVDDAMLAALVSSEPIKLFDGAHAVVEASVAVVEVEPAVVEAPTPAPVLRPAPWVALLADGLTVKLFDGSDHYWQKYTSADRAEATRAKAQAAIDAGGTLRGVSVVMRQGEI